ncbi:YihY/virulence factor BrkB family protein [Albimonas sp. CAU 1670]|uniref:YihY/virulence factor BrkB family protein n=1 Tax=Albimonas sp. CAU 1670 TaxID=3032599 RepID=UPI0023DAC52C|nr:YihY/virulence factor BrkB family protein [Albimonas sp. CAU 1670]MDF2232133.1 YihY/virulence factor BrkB family protein [Albimonas sp. CAU 1670]
MNVGAFLRARLLGDAPEAAAAGAPAAAAAPVAAPPAAPQPERGGPRGEGGDAALSAARAPRAGPPPSRSHLPSDPERRDPVAREFWADAPEDPFARRRTKLERFFIWAGRSLALVFSLAALKVLWSAAMRFQEHEGFMLSGHIAYSALLALFPFLIFCTSFAAATIGPGELQALIELMFEIAPEQVADAMRPILEQALGVERRGLLTISGLGALWAASNGVEAFRLGFDRAYQPPNIRNFVISRAVGLVFVMIGTGAALIMGFAVVLAPLIIELTQMLLGRAPPFGMGLLRYIIALAAFALFLYMMHAILPSGRPRARRLWPGITATILLWTAAASAFSVYLARFPTYTVTYGGLAGVIVTLLFFYLSGAVILYGAEVNAAIHRREAEAEAERRAKARERAAP